MPVEFKFTKSINDMIEYLTHKYDVEKLPFDIGKFRFAVSNAIGSIYADELSEIAQKSGLKVMEQRIFELEDIENKRTEKQLQFEMFKIINNKKSEPIIKSHGPENVYVMFEHISESMNSNSRLLADELQEIRTFEIIQK